MNRICCCWTSLSVIWTRNCGQQMRVELKSLQEKVKATFLFVTHDQIEAMTLADRILVMQNGHIQQLGSPGELYRDPVTPFVHAFLGKSIHLDAERVEVGGSELARLSNGCTLEFPDADEASGTRLIAGLRPEDLEFVASNQEPQTNDISATVRKVIYLGDRYEVALETCGVEFVMSAADDTQVRGEQVLLRVKKDRLKVWPA